MGHKARVGPLPPCLWPLLPWALSHKGGRVQQEKKWRLSHLAPFHVFLPLTLPASPSLLTPSSWGVLCSHRPFLFGANRSDGECFGVCPAHAFFPPPGHLRPSWSSFNPPPVVLFLLLAPLALSCLLTFLLSAYLLLFLFLILLAIQRWNIDQCSSLSSSLS